MGVLNLEALASTRLQTSPWPHARLTEAILPARRQELEAGFPDAGYHWFIQYLLAEAKGDRAGMQQHRVMTRTLIDLGANEIDRGHELADVWHELAEELSSSTYREVLSDVTSVDLGRASFRADFWRYHPSSFFSPHIDKPHKVVTHLIYLSGAWDEDDGGQLQIFDGAGEQEPCEEISPATGSGAILAYRDDALHGVRRVRPGCPRERRNIQVWFYLASK